MPRAQDIDDFSLRRRNGCLSGDVMGMKGACETDTIGAYPAVMNAMVDAFDREYGIKYADMLLTPGVLYWVFNSG